MTRLELLLREEEIQLNPAPLSSHPRSAHCDVSVVMVTDTSTINDSWDPTYSIFVALDGPNLRVKYQFHHLDAGFRVTVVTHKNLCKE